MSRTTNSPEVLSPSKAKKAPGLENTEPNPFAFDDEQSLIRVHSAESATTMSSMGTADSRLTGKSNSQRPLSRSSSRIPKPKPLPAAPSKYGLRASTRAAPAKDSQPKTSVKDPRKSSSALAAHPPARTPHRASVVIDRPADVLSVFSNDRSPRTVNSLTSSPDDQSTRSLIPQWYEDRFASQKATVDLMLQSKLKLNNKYSVKEIQQKAGDLIKTLKEQVRKYQEEVCRFSSDCAAIEYDLRNDLHSYKSQAYDLGCQLRVCKTELNEHECLYMKLEAMYESEKSTNAEAKQKTQVLNDRIKTLEVEKVHFKEGMSQANEECTSAQLELQQTKAALEQLRQSKELELRQERENASAKVDALQRDLKAENSDLKSIVRRKEDEFNILNQSYSDLQRDLSNMLTRIARMEGEMKGGEDESIRLREEYSRMSKELEASRRTLLEKEVELNRVVTQLSSFQTSHAQREAEFKDTRNVLESRIVVLEAEKHAVQEELSNKKQETAGNAYQINCLEEQVASLKAQLEKTDLEYRQLLLESGQASQQLAVERELRFKAEEREGEERKERVAATASLIATQQEMRQQIVAVREEAQEKMKLREKELELYNVQMQQLRSSNEEVVEEKLGLEAQVRELKDSLSAAHTHTQDIERLSRVSGEADVLRRRLQEMEEMRLVSKCRVCCSMKLVFRRQRESREWTERLEEVNLRLQEGEVIRRKMHNTIQELRGNVRVFARVRPFLPSDGVDCDTARGCISVKPDGVSLHILRPVGEDDKTVTGERAEPVEHTFTFDKSFAPSTGQEAVFEEVSEFVQSALDGYHVCLFSYGQTGAGKTHTMQGSGHTQMRGIIPRAIAKVGSYKEDRRAHGWEYHMEVSFIEIYNEKIQDLLTVVAQEPKFSTCALSKPVMKSGPSVLHIPVDPCDTDTVDEIIRSANRARSTAHTDMNTDSSRSHSVFTLHLRAEHVEENTCLSGSLSLVDLAGSERLSRSHATGDRLRETQAINKSLSSLADVFTALAKKQSHVPYRNSLLTQLLQRALSGDGKTLMMVNLSPTEESYQETLCSLRFAAQVNQCELGKPKRHITTAGSAPTSTPSSASVNLRKTARK